jgi:hypothetical protein
MSKGPAMYADPLSAKIPGTLDEIWTRVYYALARHPLCRDIVFDVVHTPRNARGGNWTVSMQSVMPSAIWEASEIVADIQDAYDLVTDTQGYATAA